MSARRRGLAFILVGVLAAAIGIVAYATGALSRLELNSFDTRVSIRGPQIPSPEVAVVAIDDQTFSDLGVQWPFPRSLHGRLIDRLARDGAKAIAYDVQFTEPTTPKQDNALIERRRSRRPRRSRHHRGEGRRPQQRLRRRLRYCAASARAPETPSSFPTLTARSAVFPTRSRD